MEILLYLVVMLLVVAITAKPVQQDPAAAQDIDANTIESGKPISVLFGEVDKPAHLVWYGDTKTREIKSDGGKK